MLYFVKTQERKEAIAGTIFTYYLMELYISLRIYPILNITHDLLTDMVSENVP